MRRALVTGGAGFIGTNTADRLLRDGWRVRLLDDLSRPGVERNLAWLESEHRERLEVEIADLRNDDVARRAVRDTDVIFHFAAQVAVTTSLVDPLHDALVNVRGTLNLLEAARSRPRPPSLLFTSTNKVYGSLPDVELREEDRRYRPADPAIAAHGISERRPLAFCTPYGCSKGAADQYVLDYAKCYGLASLALRMSCIYGPRQFGTEDQGWVAHFLIQAAARRPITIYGDGKQVRDILYVEDLVSAVVAAQERAPELAGMAFNIGGGPHNTISPIELLAMIQELSGEGPEVVHRPWRARDQRYYVSDIRAFERKTGWEPIVAPDDGIEALYEWLLASGRLAAA
jgi:CDP-paratose 2-epimerase